MNDDKTEGQLIERFERAPAASYGQFLMEALRDPNLPTSDKQMLLNMRREVLADEAREAFDQAYVAMSAELPQVERDGTVALVKDGVEKGRYPFTTIEAMDVILRPLLAKYGLAITFSSVEEPDGVKMVGWLLGHGHRSEPSTYKLPPDTGPGRNAIQARGSSRRYAKRYITDDLCNVVRKGKDDDARGAMEALIDAAQIKELTDLLKATNTQEAAFLKMMVSGAETLADVRQRDHTRLVMALREKKTKQAARK